MKKILSLVFCILITGVLISCSSQNTCVNQSFFAWMDSYIALPKDSKSTIALTCFFKKNNAPFHKDDISAMGFKGLEQTVKISDFTIEDNKGFSSNEYSSYVMTLTFNAAEKGIFKTNHIVLCTNNGNHNLSYPIGQWVFDIGESEPETEYVNTWESPAALSNRNEFAYDYSVNNKHIKMLKIWIGENTYVSDENGLPASGNIKIAGNQSAPVNYIKTKLELNINGSRKIVYGKGCYCGAIGISDDLITFSKQNSDKNKIEIDKN